MEIKNQHTEQVVKFEECFAKLELFGHAVLYGKVSECQIAGAAFLRIEVLGSDGIEQNTEYINPSSVYALRPITEELCRTCAQGSSHAPVSVYGIEDALKRTSIDRIEDYLTKRKALELGPAPAEGTTPPRKRKRLKSEE